MFSTLRDTRWALGAGVESLFFAALAYFAPRGLLVLLAAWAFLREELAAGTAVQAAGGDLFGIGYDGLHVLHVVFAIYG